MDDNEIDIRDRIKQAVGEEKPNVEYLENGVGPNFRVAIAPNGYIWGSVGVDLISSQFYCDSQVARAMSSMLAKVADEYDKVHAEIRAIAGMQDATNVIQLPLGLGDAQDTDEAEAAAIVMEHEIAVDDAVVAAEQKFD